MTGAAFAIVAFVGRSFLSWVRATGRLGLVLARTLRQLPNLDRR